MTLSPNLTLFLLIISFRIIIQEREDTNVSVDSPEPMSSTI
jgi:hypothetical protein